MLAIMVAVVLIAGASLRNGFRTQRLTKAADQVRIAWGKARNQAIKSGRVQVFYHARDGAQYLVIPQTSFDDPVIDSFGMGTNTNGARGFGVGPNSVGPNGSGPQGLGANTGMNPYASWDLQTTQTKKLPRGVVFLGADVRLDQRSALMLTEAQDPQSFGFMPVADEETNGLSTAQWGMPIYFFPDGTTSSAQMMLRNETSQVVSIYLRGLTGLARVGRVQSADEVSLMGGAL